jgi:uncharacterized protein
MPDDFDFQHEVDQFLGTSRTASLSTVSSDGKPHAANLQYAVDKDWSLYFVSNPETVHASNIAIDPAVALTIYGHTDNWREIHGLQIKGECFAATDDADRSNAWTWFKLAYPFVDHNEELKARIDNECFYVIKPTWIRWIDNRRGFGFKVEKDLAV